MSSPDGVVQVVMLDAVFDWFIREMEKHHLKVVELPRRPEDPEDLTTYIVVPGEQLVRRGLATPEHMERPRDT